MTYQTNYLKLPILSFVSVACPGLDPECLKNETNPTPPLLNWATCPARYRPFYRTNPNRNPPPMKYETNPNLSRRSAAKTDEQTNPNQKQAHQL